MYLDAYAIWEGATDEERTFRDRNKAYSRWAERIIREAKREGADVQVYAILHGHANDGQECECVQYLTDHHPDYTTRGEQ